MGNLNVNQINGQDAQAGKAKAWANVKQKDTQAINDSYNVTSITDNGTGQTGVSYTNPFAAANNYVPTAGCRYTEDNSGVWNGRIAEVTRDTGSMAAGATRYVCITGNTLEDQLNLFVNVTGDLA